MFHFFLEVKPIVSVKPNKAIAFLTGGKTDFFPSKSFQIIKKGWALFFLCLLLIGVSVNAYSQKDRSNEYTVLLFNVNFGGQIPAGDLSDRFGSNSSIGGGLQVITEKNNWIFGLNGFNLFSKNVKEDVLASLRDSDGFILGSGGAGQGGYAAVFLRERGFYAGGYAGKLFSISQKNKRSGIRATLGMGLLQHKVRIQDESDNADQLSGDLAKGYDQLTNGLALQQFIGYQFLSKSRGINFFAGLELTEAFTKNRRDFNFSTQSRDTNSRFDVLLGFRVGWSIAFYVGERGEDIEY